MLHKNKILPLLLLLLSIVPAQAKKQSVIEEQMQKLDEAYYLILDKYVEKISPDSLCEFAIESMVEALDPHSNYFSAQEIKEISEQLEGAYDGVGIYIESCQDTLRVMEVIPDGPAQKAGIEAGDKIVSINDSVVASRKLSNEALQTMLRGKKGSKVSLGIIRDGEPRTIVVKRAQVPLNSVTTAFMIDSLTGYIAIECFSETTYKEFKTALDKLLSAGMHNLIIDLQANTGGYVNSATDILSELLAGDKISLVCSEGANIEPSCTYKLKKQGAFEKGRLAVLIDEYSASASEIVAGAVQDWDRGVVVGRRSFGKGLIQRPYSFADGSQLFLTVARYHTPSGRCIQRPYDDGREAYEEAFEGRFDHKEHLEKDSIAFADTLKFKTLVSGREIYGGGGIMPDVFVPADTAGFTQLYDSLTDSDMIMSSAIKYCDIYRKQLLQQYTPASFFSDFDMSGAMQLLKNEAVLHNIQTDKDEWLGSENFISLQYRLAIIRILWGFQEFYAAYATTDKVVQAALTVLNNPDRYNQILAPQDYGKR